jgi:hypothetical protein
MGSTQVLPNGNALVGWGSEPYLTEFAADGSIRFDARLPHKGQNYRVVRFPWTGRPAEPPRIATAHGGESARVYASWNGSTELAAWEVHTGAREGALSAAGKVTASGFETAIELQTRGKYAAVRALDAAGKPLATSPTIAL